jgi:hypothetical protein
MNTALNAASISAPSVGEAIFSIPDFNASKVDGTDSAVPKHHPHDVVLSPSQPEIIEMDQSAPSTQHVSRVQS